MRWRTRIAEGWAAKIVSSGWFAMPLQIAQRTTRSPSPHGQIVLSPFPFALGGILAVDFGESVLQGGGKA